MTENQIRTVPIRVARCHHCHTKFEYVPQKINSTRTEGFPRCPLCGRYKTTSDFGPVARFGACYPHEIRTKGGTS